MPLPHRADRDSLALCVVLYTARCFEIHDLVRVSFRALASRLRFNTYYLVCTIVPVFVLFRAARKRGEKKKTEQDPTDFVKLFTWKPYNIRGFYAYDSSLGNAIRDTRYYVVLKLYCRRTIFPHIL